MIAAGGHDAGSAFGAFEQTRQDAPGLAVMMRAGNGFALGQPACDGRPQIFIDNAELRGFRALPLAFRIDAWNPLAGRRIFAFADAVPDYYAAIDLVVQHPGRATARAVERRGVPGAAAHRRDVVGIEQRCDRARRLSVREGAEDAAHNLRFRFADLVLARAAGDRPIAVRKASRAHAGAQLPGEAAARLVRQIRKIERAHQAAHADLDLIGFAVMHGRELTAGKFELLPDGGKIAHVARQPVERFDDHDIHAGCAGHRHQIREALAAVNRCAGLRAIAELRRDDQAFAGAEAAAKGELIVDRAIALEFAGESGVERGALHYDCSEALVGGCDSAFFAAA